MSKHIHKSHNVSVLIYHLVFPAKYRRSVFDEKVDDVLKSVCLEIEKKYQIEFLEIGTDKNHVHFLVQSVPTYSVTKIVTMIKSLTAREIFKNCPHVKKQLWGGEFWSDGYFASTVGQHGNETVIQKYVHSQGDEYSKLHPNYIRAFSFRFFKNTPPLAAGQFIPRMQGKQEELNYFDEVNKIIPTCQIHFHLEEVSYCLNSWDNNYQHFIVETLPKIHVSVLEKNCPVVVLDMPFIREIVMIAYPDVEFIFIKDDVGVEANFVNIPMPVAQNFESIVNLQMLAFDNLRNKILFPVPQTSKKLYLARIHTDGLAGRFRRMTNDSEVMEFFVNNNFVVDDFVDKTLVEKMILTAKFRKHVTPIGANLINYLFTQNSIDLYVLSHPYFNSHQYFINLFEAMKLPIKYHIIPAGIEAVGEDNWVGHLNSPYRIDMNILATHLD